MTRSVRFSPFVRAGVFACALGAAGPLHAREVPFAAPLPVYTVAGPVSHWALADIDGDADTDLLVASPAEGRLLLLRNMDGVGAAWSPVTVSTAASDARDVVAGDIDHDGDMDAASVSYPSGLLAWHENLDGNGTSWATHTIPTDAGMALDLADIDRDGDLDVVAEPGVVKAPLRWYRNDGGGAAWTARTIGPYLFGEANIETVDLDRDGDPDVLALDAGYTLWFENTDGGSNWPYHDLGGDAPGGVAAGDIDGDGDPDVVGFGAWYENTSAGSWPLHVFLDPGGYPLSLPTPVDVDSDGDLDIWGFENSVVWYDNLAGDGLQWARRVVAAPSNPLNATPVDLDGDGDLDGLSASGAGPTVVSRHLNETLHRTACFAPPATVFTAVDPLNRVVIADLDRDGDVDLVPADAVGGRLLWHENGANGASWTPHALATVFAPHSAATADIDRDGDTDVVSNSGVAPHRALWLENLSAGASFTIHTISTVANAAYGSQVVAGDIDGDGDVDVFQSGNELGGWWYANASGDGSTWAPGILIGGTSGELADIDGDGDLDVASAHGDFSGMHNVGWRENVAGTAAAWVFHTISTAVFWPWVITAGDVDGDGDVDFAHVGLASPELGWRINEGAGSAWTLRTVPGATGVVGGTLADLDRDGDLDLPWAGQSPPRLEWHENRNGLGSEWLGHTLPLIGAPSDVGRPAAADIDRDGDIDLIVGSGTFASGFLAWYPNRGGQFSLAGENTAPGTTQQGEMVSMLRVVATHLGRAGDGPLELARFGVLLEEAAGDPLTSSEANLLVESLRVYRDANGNGTFEPTDTLVASIGTLSLAAGVQDVPFADGDPNVAVAFGTPQTFFVVIELTADAATQNPNRVRTTLLQLGRSASQAEHAAYDLAISPACPADVASGVTVAVVPVELMGFSIE